MSPAAMQVNDPAGKAASSWWRMMVQLVRPDERPDLSLVDMGYRGKYAPAAQLRDAVLARGRGRR